MPWLLSYLKKVLGSIGCRLPGDTGAGSEYTLYTREKGPICYEIRLFCWDAPAERFLEQVLRSSVRWYWESSRRYEPNAVSAQLGLPANRGVTLLTEASADEFMQDLKERDVSGDMRFIVLYGLDPAVSPSSQVTVWLHDALQEFLRKEQGPLWMVIIQIGDCNYEQVFVTHAPPAPILELLRAWGIADRPPRWVRRYRALGVAKLEDTMLPLSLYFP